MDGSEIAEYPPLSKPELEKLSRGSIVKIFDPESSVWYWAVVERRMKDDYLQGRIDAHCILGPTLRHGGTAFFHQDNVLQIWPVRVNPMFDALWFRILSHIISFGAGAKAIKLPTNGS